VYEIDIDFTSAFGVRHLPPCGVVRLLRYCLVVTVSVLGAVVTVILLPFLVNPVVKVSSVVALIVDGLLLTLVAVEDGGVLVESVSTVTVDGCLVDGLDAEVAVVVWLMDELDSVSVR